MRTLLSLLLLVVSLHAAATEPAAAAAPGAEPIHFCTTTCLDHGGTCIFGENFDFPVSRTLVFVNKRGMVKHGFDPGMTGEVARWTSRYGSVTFNMMGFGQPFSGMNEAGLVGATMYLPSGGMTRFDARPSLSAFFWVQYQLDNFATVREVVDSAAKIRNSGAFVHYLFCDRTGECATIETFGGKLVVHRGASLPVKALANATYQESLDAWRGGGSTYDDAVNRFRIAADLLTAHARQDAGRRQVDATSPANADAAAVHYAFYVQSSVSRPSTVWTAVFDNKNLQVHFMTPRDPRVRQITFARLDFSGATPARMLDVHAEVSGDISDELPAYSHDESLAHSLHMARAMPGILPGVPGMADEAVEVMLGWVERFPYAGDEAGAAGKGTQK
jgi:choloylglycine hydrolase